MANPPKSATTFEAAIERLEEIVAQMESDQLPLDALIERYEEGTQLIGICQEKLKAAEQRIEMVTRKSTTNAFPPTNDPIRSNLTNNDPDVSLF